MARPNVSLEDLALHALQLLTATTNQPAETEPATPVAAEKFVRSLTTVPTCLQSVEPIHVLEMQSAFQVD